MNINHIHRMYFLGIGGIGMSALARHFAGLGKDVAGYDRVPSMVTDILEKAGVSVHFEAPTLSSLGAIDLVVYTPALSQDFPLLQAARSAGVPVLKRSEVLGFLSQQYRTLAVAGTHGKTTSSTMLAHVLTECGADPSAFLGGIARNFGGNYRLGHSEWMVTEADEFDRSFMTLHPEATLFTSLDADHLDIYGDASTMEATYLAFAAQSERLVVAHALRDRAWPKPFLSYGLGEGDFQAQNIRFGALATEFDWVAPDFRLDNLHLPLPGIHNVLNMTGALALAYGAGVDLEAAPAAIRAFQGIYRRFEVQLDLADRTFIDDYAHHPTEIAAAIDTARQLFPERRLVVVFQPHLYSRTADFYREFAHSLQAADQVLLLPIYPARETAMPGVTTDLILQQLPKGKGEEVAKAALPEKLIPLWQAHTTILTLGAGDIDREVPRLKHRLQQLIQSPDTLTP